MPHSPKVRQGAPYKKFLNRLGRAPARRLYELQALLAGALPTLADQLGVTVEDLIATPKRSARKRGPASKLQQQLERISALPKAQQRFVMQMLDTVLQQKGG